MSADATIAKSSCPPSAGSIVIKMNRTVSVMVRRGRSRKRATASGWNAWFVDATCRPRFSAWNVSCRLNHSCAHSRSRSGFFHDARSFMRHVHTHGVRVFACISHGSYARLTGISGLPVSSRTSPMAFMNHASSGPGVVASTVVTCVLSPTGSTHSSISRGDTNAASSTICRSAM